MTYATQPPSGGCVLKHFGHGDIVVIRAQPPSGGCVLKHFGHGDIVVIRAQPPSGGCVLKRLTEYQEAYGETSRLQAAVC